MMVFLLLEGYFCMGKFELFTFSSGSQNQQLSQRKGCCKKSSHFSMVLPSPKSRPSWISLICSPPVLFLNISPRDISKYLSKIFLLLFNLFYYSCKKYWSGTNDSSLLRNWIIILLHKILWDQILFVMSPDSCLDTLFSMCCKLEF